ncbi:MAG TPA: tRNA dihydrouridine synthase DusB [Spongiibacteraceae bacterium]|mgnify:FL=1|nr:tRNA dihydrouridine synthase DusB [Spongiibacteraceae bacterium]HCS27830.1 tRNA dihydrouridine synthase DusB [Spongiibacteraceae bacterium]
MIRIGHFSLPGRAVLAPMAGVTDLPFRRICRQFGASLTVSEMVISNAELRDSRKTRLRLAHDDGAPKAVQIAGADPAEMAAAAKYNETLGAELIDINMGCPAKKVCRREAGSALLRDPALVKAILEAVVSAVSVPVTLKFRTGWSPEHRNGVEIAAIAEDAGIQSLAVHGRTRACRYNGQAEYDTIAAIKQRVSLPVFANGDICTPQQARDVLAYTGADGVMIGRGAQGRPWLFREINHYLATGELAEPVSRQEFCTTLESHVRALHQFYGERQGLKIARKHLSWYLQGTAGTESVRKHFNGLLSAREQLDAIEAFAEGWQQYDTGEIAA